MARSKLNTEFAEETVTIRGTTYRFRELSGAEYDDCLRSAERPGEDNEGVDLTALLRIMAARALQDPKLTLDELQAKPYPVLRQLYATVNKMHFSDDALGEATEEGTDEDAPKPELGA